MVPLVKMIQSTGKSKKSSDLTKERATGVEPATSSLGSSPAVIDGGHISSADCIDFKDLA